MKSTARNGDYKSPATVDKKVSKARTVIKFANKTKKKRQTFQNQELSQLNSFRDSTLCNFSQNRSQTGNISPVQGKVEEPGSFSKEEKVAAQTPREPSEEGGDGGAAEKESKEMNQDLDEPVHDMIKNGFDLCEQKNISEATFQEEQTSQ